jgi:hypothetical protein
MKTVIPFIATDTLIKLNLFWSFPFHYFLDSNLFGKFKSAKKHSPSKIKIRLMAGIKERDVWRELLKRLNTLPLSMNNWEAALALKNIHIYIEPVAQLHFLVPWVSNHNGHP